MNKDIQILDKRIAMEDTELLDRMIADAQTICKLNKGAAISGSLMLFLRGINLNRHIKNEIDIVFDGDIKEIEVPYLYECVDLDEEVDYTSNRFYDESRGIYLDFTEGSVPVTPDIILRIPLMSVESLIIAKKKYIRDKCSGWRKHEIDLVILERHGFQI